MGKASENQDRVEDFIYLVAHNLKSPLVSIQGYLSLLDTDFGADLDPEAAHYLKRIHKNVEFMDTMIRDLLALARVEKVALTLDRVDVDDIIEDVIDELSLLIVEKKIEVKVPDKLPEIRGEAQGMRTVLSNLLNNAVRYMGDSEKPEIEISYSERDNEHVLTVEDNGRGMDPKFVPKAFDLFQRGVTRTEVEGTGIGLTMVKRIVEKHNGWVKLQSEKGKWTRVEFAIPRS